MQLVVEELKQNTSHIRDIEQRVRLDRIISRRMLDSNFRCESFPKDTLAKCVGFATLMQKIENKTLLLTIIQMYERSEQTRKNRDLLRFKIRHPQ